MDHPWIVRTSNIARRLDAGNDTLSMASSYLQTSVLSSKSKRINIDNILDEHELVMDRVKEIDDRLKANGADDVKSTKDEMIKRAVENKHIAPSIDEIHETKDILTAGKNKIKPTMPKEDLKTQTVNVKDTSNEIDMLQKLLNNTEVLNEVIRLSQMMIKSKIDCRILEFLKRGVNKEYEVNATQISIANFHKYWKNLIKPEVEELDPTIENKVLHFVTTKEGDQIDKTKLFTLIDFYQYYPVYVQGDRNFSKEMYYVMSSNTDGGYNWKEGLKTKELQKFDQNKELIYLLEYINDKVTGKYPRLFCTTKHQIL
jgi:hypothetical protein